MKRMGGFLWVLWISAGLTLSAPTFGAELAHEVRDGESASSIAKRYYGGFELTELLLRYNGKTGAVLQPGETLRVPFCDTHTVRSGDTWSEIAQRYLGQAADYDVIARMNDLKPERALKVGDRILIPVFVSHSLGRGETLSLLAERYYGDSDRGDLLRSSNRIDDPRRLSVGQQIRIPLIVPPVKSPPPPPPARRFVEPLNAARRAFHAGDYEDALGRLEPLIQRIEHEGNLDDRTELWALLAFVYVAFDRTEEACVAYGWANSHSPQPPLNPDLVSPKIREALADCRATAHLRARR